jgi:hypothetical protein
MANAVDPNPDLDPDLDPNSPATPPLNQEQRDNYRKIAALVKADPNDAEDVMTKVSALCSRMQNEVLSARLSKRELTMCSERGVDVVAYARTRAAIRARSVR